MTELNVGTEICGLVVAKVFDDGVLIHRVGDDLLTSGFYCTRARALELVEECRQQNRESCG